MPIEAIKERKNEKKKRSLTHLDEVPLLAQISYDV